EFVHEEIRHVREGKHGARSTKQSYRDRALQGEARGSKVAAAEGGDILGENADSSGPRLYKGAEITGARGFAPEIQGDSDSPPAGGQASGIPHSIIAASARQRRTARAG